MSHRHISFQSEFGINLHEQGLNRLSAGLRATKPHLFAFRTEIPIIQPSDGNPGHTLTLYAVLDEPLAFNLYPVVGNPEILKDAFFVSANLLFTLTDSQIGSVTRIRIRTESAAGITRLGSQLSVVILEKADGGPWFDITSLEGEHPALLTNSAEADLSALAPGDEETARSFRAIMNYLITLFLKEGLMRTVREFPLPPLGDLIDAGPLGMLPGRDIYIRNDAVYLTMGNELLGDGAFPGAAAQNDLTIGVAESGLQRILDLMSPMPVPIDVGDDNTTLRLRSSDFRVSKIKADLRPGHDKLLGFVSFGGTLGLRLQFTAFGRWVRTPYLPLPIDASLSHFGGLILPYLTKVNDGKTVELRMRPDTKFFEAWYVFVVTNYRGLFRDLIRRLVDSVKDNLVYKVFKKVPILGWILDKVIDITGDILAWALGGVLDVFMSSFLTLIINTIGRVVLQLMDRPSFKVFSIEQSSVKEMTGLTITGGELRQVDDGRGGELQVGISLADGFFPSPPPPLPTPPVPEPTPIPELPSPNLPTLPEFPASDFEPPFAMDPPRFPSVMERFSLKLQGGMASLQGRIEVQYEIGDEKFRIVKTTYLDQSMHPTSRVIGEYQITGEPLTIEYQHGIGEDSTSHVRQSVRFGPPGHAAVSHVAAEGLSFDTDIEVMDTARMEADELWLFRLAHSSVSAPVNGRFGRLELADPLSFRNWARMVPVEVSVTETVWVDGTVILNVLSSDIDGKIVARISPAEGLLDAEIETPNGKVVIKRQI